MQINCIIYLFFGSHEQSIIKPKKTMYHTYNLESPAKLKHIFLDCGVKSMHPQEEQGNSTQISFWVENDSFVLFVNILLEIKRSKDLQLTHGICEETVIFFVLIEGNVETRCKY